VNSPGAAAYPRVLFVTPCAFNRSTGGGITFSNLFAGWPKDRLATVHSDTIPVTTDVCEHYYHLGNKEIRRWFPFQAASATQSSSLHRRAGHRSRPTLVVRMAKFIKTCVFGNGLPEKGIVSPELETWVREFNPDLIYTTLGSIALLEIISTLKSRLGVPLAVHLMDDWQSSIYKGGLLSVVQRRTLQRLLFELIRDAAVRMGICEAMAKGYEKRYQVPFLWFQNTLDLAKFEQPDRAVRNDSDEIKLVYTGSILEYAQLHSLADVCRAVSELSKEGHRVRLAIYSPNFEHEAIREALLIDSSISLQDTIIDDNVFFDTLHRADFLVLPVNFDEDSIHYIRYSMPTKVPAYLVSGTPVLVYGPATVAQVEYAATDGWGEVISKRGVGGIKRAILALWHDVARREHLSACAKEVARRNHDSRVVRLAFQDALRHGALRRIGND